MDEPKVTIDIEAEDQLGMLVRKITLESDVKGDLRKQARTVIEKITYLQGGELKVVEVDGPRNAVQIRSKKVDQAYIEVVLRNGNFVSLERKPAALFISKADFDRLVRDLKDIF